MSNFWTDFQSLVEDWAARFRITVEDFTGMDYGPYARFTGVTDDGDRLPLGASWNTREDMRNVAPVLEVWLDTQSLGMGHRHVALARTEDFVEAFEVLDQSRTRRGRRRGR